MIIGIDGNEANQRIRAGSGVYGFELLSQFKKFKIQNSKFKIYLKNEPIGGLPKESVNWEYKIVGPQSYWTQIGLPVELWKEKLIGEAPDVFFSPSHYAPRFCPIPSVITVFDLSFIRFTDLFLKKDLYQLKHWTQYSVHSAKKIITISEFSKKEIRKYYNVQSDKIVVAYPGYDKQKFRIQNSPASPGTGRAEFRIKEVKSKYKIDNNYILYVGTIQPRKNISRLIDAFKLLNNDYPDLKLVLAGMLNEGRGGWMNDEFIHQTQNKIIITGFVDSEDLPYLIAGAKALVLPSLYEGFGIPVIEAMACGVPTVVSNISSLPEITGNAAILVDPYKIDSISNGIKEACYNNKKREELIKLGLQRVKNFSWENSARIILDVLQSI